MPKYKLNRDHTHRSINGVVSFVKDEPTWVVPVLEKEVVAIGAERVDGDNPEVLDPVAPEVLPLSPSERADELNAAFALLVERNTSSDFTGAGVPTVKAVEKIVSFTPDRSEIAELWAEFKITLGAAG